MSRYEHRIPNWLTYLVTISAVVIAGGLWFLVLKYGGMQRLREVDTAVAITHGGNVEAGYRAILAKGCGACHAISGVPRATGQIGPSLSDFKDRAMIAGVMANSADNLMKWLQDPRSVDAKT